jgi:2'-5' RNA ligase
MLKRLFIAIDPEPALLDTIFRLTSTLKREYPIKGVRYTAPQNLHLTFLFLGDIDEDLIPQIGDKLERICRNFTEFDWSFQILVHFLLSTIPALSGWESSIQNLSLHWRKQLSTTQV